MSTYRKIHGRSIQAVTTDPTESVAEGQIWYNTGSDTFKTVLLSEAWASGNSILTGRYNLGGSGTQTAGLIAGGTTPGIVTNTEHFDGVGWRNGGTLNVGRDSATMFGLSTAATFVGGYAPSPNGFRALVEEYNGTAWSEETDMPAPRAQGASAGTQTDGIVFGGNQGPPGSPETTATTTLEYDGSSWTTGGAMSVNDRYIMGCGGSQAQALRVGGESDTDATEEYDGSSWTTGGNLNTGRNQGAASGTNTAGLVFGGNPNRTNTEGYDGTSWSNKPALATGVEDTSGSAQGTNAEAFQAGQSASPISIVQNWNSSANVVTAGAWASGGALSTSRRYIRGFGTKTAGVAASGYTTSPSDKTEEYDGSSYSNGGNLGTARYSAAACGILTAGLLFGGLNTTPSKRAQTEQYDGSSWSEQSDLNTARGELGGCGTTAAALAFGGQSAPPGAGVDTTEEWGGSSWTSSPNGLNQARKGEVGGAGTQTAAVAFAGSIPPNTGATEEYNGSSWTAGNALITARSQVSPSQNGTQSAVLSIGGNPVPSAIGVEGYDGTSWSTRPALSTNRRLGAGFATTSDAVLSGGYTTTNLSITEEFTGETTAVNVKTLTQS